ncbi:hypothetical protein HYH02_012119 [Chlamydomonas schloesseri]|uniref:Uncharacterized protein n=1 Tax=Chlamydomonas schloesseri TaxID=2026947 RepID=A0A835W3V0_9CHLO|nr:hypothetical protein HYH02_012119 [Chlamydomonas schloesseri]|eukprot:KAG2434921.1 hypothetical protein HYH02_012119 [Chlamydomonas schloesseri]
MATRRTSPATMPEMSFMAAVGDSAPELEAYHRMEAMVDNLMRDDAQLLEVQGEPAASPAPCLPNRSWFHRVSARSPSTPTVSHSSHVLYRLVAAGMLSQSIELITTQISSSSPWPLQPDGKISRKTPRARSLGLELEMASLAGQDTSTPLSLGVYVRVQFEPEERGWVIQAPAGLPGPDPVSGGGGDPSAENACGPWRAEAQGLLLRLLQRRQQVEQAAQLQQQIDEALAAQLLLQQQEEYMMWHGVDDLQQQQQQQQYPFLLLSPERCLLGQQPYTLWQEESEEPEEEQVPLAVDPILLLLAWQAGYEDQQQLLQTQEQQLAVAALAAAFAPEPTLLGQGQQCQPAEQAGAEMLVAADAAREKQARKEAFWHNNGWRLQLLLAEQQEQQLPVACASAVRWSADGGGDIGCGSGSDAGSGSGSEAGGAGSGSDPGGIRSRSGNEAGGGEITTPSSEADAAHQHMPADSAVRVSPAAQEPQQPQPQPQCQQSRRRCRGNQHGVERAHKRQREQEVVADAAAQPDCKSAPHRKRRRGRRGGKKAATRRLREHQGAHQGQLPGGSVAGVVSPTAAYPADRGGALSRGAMLARHDGVPCALPKTPPHPTFLVALVLARRQQQAAAQQGHGLGL